MITINNKKLFWFAAVVVLFSVFCIGYFYFSRLSRHTFHVTFLNVGQGDSALITFANGETMLVDCGPNSIILSRLGRELPFYVRTIDYLVATHPDLDHYGGCTDVLRRYQVKHIIVNGRGKNDPYWHTWDAAMRQEGADIQVVEAPFTLTIASSTLQFLAPDDSLGLNVATDDSNNYSIAFKLTANTGKTFLFTGDMETPLEQALISKYCTVTSTPAGGENFQPAQCAVLRSDVLKVGHHGSNSSSGEEFLRVVDPTVATVSVGKNKYGHPSLRVLKHLERAGATILRTDQLGAIVIK